MLKKIIGILSFAIMATMLIVVSFASEAKTVNEIKIGCWSENDFLCCQNTNGSVDGYLPRYLNEVKKIFNSKFPEKGAFRFTYHFGDLKELQEQLEKGEIDAVIGYDQRNDYPDIELIKTKPVFDMQLTLSSQSGNERFYFMNTQGIDKANVGYLFSPTASRIDSFAEENGISLTKQFCFSERELKERLQNGSIDLALLPFQSNDKNTQILLFLGETKLCFYIRKGSQYADIVSESIDFLDSTYPTLKSQLYAQSLKNSNYNFALTKEERDFVKSGYKLRFASSKNERLLYYDEEQQKYAGPYAALLQCVMQCYGMDYEVVFADSINEALKIDADVLLGMVASEKLENTYNISFSEPYSFGFSSFWTAKGRTVNFDEPNKIGTVRSIESVNEHINLIYPQWDIILYSSMDKAVKAVKEGEVDLLIMDNIIEGNDLEASGTLTRLYNFNIPQLDLSMGINQNKETGYIVEGLLNKGFTSIGGETISSVMYNNRVPTYSLRTILKQHKLLIDWLSMILILGALLLFAIHYHRLYKVAYFNRDLKIHNRNFLIKYGSSFCRPNTAIVYIDIAKLKQINMVWGAMVGNQVRKFVAHKIWESSTSDIIVSETSSLNYICIMPYIDTERINDYIQKTLCQMSLYDDGAISIPLEFHVGVYVNTHGHDIYVSLARAEMALFEAKRQHKPICYFDISLEEKQKKDRLIENKMQTALDNEEFKVYLQPQYNSENEHLSGAEALVRWIEKDGTIIFPDEFIPLFEKNRFVVKLDEYMFEKVCQLQRALLDRGIEPAPISVNQSRLNLSNPNYHIKLKHIADKYHLPCQLLVIEVTEYIYSTEEEITDTLNKLKQVGFKVAIDDFGSGYSSLNVLGNKSLDYIKIDHNFLRSKELDEKTKRVITAIVRISESLGVECVCEGVETEEQKDFLKQISCDYLQGYYFSVPVPLKDFLKKEYNIEDKEN